MDPAATLIHITDHLAPRLDAAELAMYLFFLRHSRLLGRDELTVGFRTTPRKLPLGIGNPGHPMCQKTCYRKLQSLAAKGCVQILEVHRGGHRLRVALPEEIPGVIPAPETPAPPSLDQLDFYSDPDRRLALLARENYRCFYCLRALDSTNFVVEHVVSRPAGDNTYKNLVAACHLCNVRKSNTPADEFLRQLYRDGFLGSEDFAARMTALQQLKRGLLRPAA